MHIATVGSQGGAVSYERGTPAHGGRGGSNKSLSLSVGIDEGICVCASTCVLLKW